MKSKLWRPFVFPVYLLVLFFLGLMLTEIVNGWIGAGSMVLATALAADRITKSKFATNRKAYPVKDATKIYAGSLVAIQADGHAVPAADAANTHVVGVAVATVDNSAGADGDLSVLVEEGLYLFVASSITQAMVGQVMYVVDDQTFDDALGTNAVKAGRLLEFVSTTSGWILVKPAGMGIATADGSDAGTTQTLANAIKASLNKWNLT